MEPAFKVTEHVVFGSWVMERVLGSGSFGKVMLFRDKQTGQLIAIKKCHIGTKTIHPDSWRKEIEILHNLHHPGLYFSYFGCCFYDNRGL